MRPPYKELFDLALLFETFSASASLLCHSERSRGISHCWISLCSYNRPHEEDHFHERSVDPKSGQIVSGDIAVQTRRVLDNVAAVLRAEGLTFDNVVKTTIFLTDLGDFQTVNEVYSSYFKQDPPARSTVQVSALPKGAKIEVEAIAAAGEAQQTAYDTSG